MFIESPNEPHDYVVLTLIVTKKTQINITLTAQWAMFFWGDVQSSSGSHIYKKAGKYEVMIVSIKMDCLDFL